MLICTLAAVKKLANKYNNVFTAVSLKHTEPSAYYYCSSVLFFHSFRSCF